MTVGKAAWMRRAGVACALLAAAWAPAQGPGPDAAAAPEAAAINHAPTLFANAAGGLVRIRAGERTTLVIEALDPDLAADGGFEPAWLGAAPDGALPQWISARDWSAGPSERPRLELTIAPPFDAAPGRHVIQAGATDARGLTALKTLAVAVSAPLCGGLEVNEDGLCRQCPAHAVPNAARTACEPCPSNTERPAGATSCAGCLPGLASDPGGACGCGPAQTLADGACVDCPPHTESLDGACAACPPGSERPAGADACAACRPGSTSPGGSACAAAPAQRAGASRKSAPTTAPDTTAPSIASADYAGSRVTLTLSEPVWASAAPAAGDFALTVTDGGSPVAVTVTAVTAAAARAGASAEMMLTLSGALGGSAAVSLTYTANRDPAKRPRDAAGNRLGAQTVAVSARRTLVVDFGSLDPPALGEDAGRVRAKVTLENPPDAGRYTGCGLRLAASSVADGKDVKLLANRQLNPGNGWSTGSARLLRVVDDGFAEGDEALVVEGHCGGGDAGMAPAASGLAREPARLTLVDDESRKVALSVVPDAIAETAAATEVTVTATLDGKATGDLALPLSLSGTATAADYSVSGAQRVAIGAGKSSGSTVLTVTPSADDDAADDTIAVDAALSGYAVTGATVTITEPPGLVASLVNRASSALPEGTGAVRAQLAIRPKPAQGTYAGCRLRLASGSVARSPADVTFPNGVKLGANNDWKARAVLLRLVDDAVAEGDEALAVEGRCASSGTAANPRHTALASRPLKLTIQDNEAAGPVTLTVSPSRIGETLGAQAVTVAAALAAPAAAPVTVALSLGAGSYSVAGTQRIEIAKGAKGGSTELTLTPTDDGNAADDAVAVTGTAPGRAVTGTSLTIREPTIVGGADLSGLGADVSVSPAAIAEGTSGAHTVSATLTGAPVPKVDVALALSVRGTATQGASHDYTLTAPAGWQDLTVRANDAHLTARAKVTVAALKDRVEDDGETVEFSVSRVTWGATVVPLNAPASATLTITEPSEKPPAPSGLTVAPASGGERHGLDASWQAVTATPPVTGYVVRHRKVAAPLPDWTDSALRTGTTAAITGLNAGTRYEVRVRARNRAGDGAESGSVYARTADGDCTVGAPRAEAPSGVRSSTELKATWAAAACAPATSIANYRVRYREDPDLEGVTNPWLEETSNGLAATLAGLTADTAYVVEVRAVAKGGDRGPWSPAGRGRTALDSRLPPRVGAPTVAAHATHGDERLDATWRRVAWVDGNGDAQPIARYQYRTRRDGGTWTAPTDATAGPSETATLTRTIAGLGAGAWHSVQVRAVNRMMGKDYPGKWSEPGRGRTWGAPGRVERPAAYRTGAKVEVVWDAPDDGGSAITGYDVAYKTQGSGWTTHPYAGCGMGACATEASIAAAARQVRVRAENAVGMGRWSMPADVQAIKLLRVSFGRASATVAEGKSLQVTVSLDGAADREVTVPLTTNGGAGSFRLDGAANNRVTFSLGESAQRFDLAALQDADNADAKVTLGLGQLPKGVLRVAPSSLTVTIEDDEAANGAPRFASAAATRAVAEDAPAGGAVGLPVAATDPDGDALTYSLAGTDAALFTIDAKGQVSLASGTALNFEAAASHALTVRAADGKDGDGDPDPAADASVAVTVNVTDVLEPPSAPDAPTVAPEANSLAVSWEEPDNAGPAITGYDVQHRADGARDWTDAAFKGTGTKATLSGLKAGTAHEVRVRAGNDEGTGGWSDASEANTLAQVALTASDALPSIAAGNAAAAVTLAGTARVDGGGKLSGEWLERAKDGTATVLAKGLELTSGTAVTRSVSSDAPAARTYGFRASHTLDGRTSQAVEWIDVEWRPSVLLSAAPATVREAKGARAVTVTAALTGTSLTAAAKTVTVSVGSGTATAADDFAAVDDFKIAIPGGARSAAGTFTLTPVKDSKAEGAETVAVTATATDGRALAVAGTTVTIDDRPQLTVAAPAKGHVTGTTGTGADKATVIDCGSGGRTGCTAILAAGTAVALTAAADAGHRLAAWTGACSGIGACTVTLNADATVGATIKAARTLTVAAPSNGKVVGKAGAATVIDCGSDCSETLVEGTVVALTAVAADGYEFDGWGGACASEASADCSVTLNADRTVSAAFASAAVAGKCDGSAVDACARGTLNSTAHADTDTHHHWRCDGANGGANSPKCGKAKEGCLAGGRSWTAGGLTCTGSVAAASSGDLKPARDSGDPTRGVASFKCNDGAWVEQAGATCTVNLGCGASENTCLTSGVDAVGLSRTRRVDGMCAATESQACTSGTPNRSSPADVVRQDGACGAGINQCTRGRLRAQASTDAAYRWQCLGIDGEKRWSCLGTDGRSDWRCEYGGRSQSCSLPDHAVSYLLCREDAGAANSADCQLCRDGYEKHGGACVAECGANEVRNSNGTCVCGAGHSRVNGKCVEVHRLIVEVDPSRKGTVTTDDTLGRSFSCSTSCYSHVEGGRNVTLSVSSEAGYSCRLSATSFRMTAERTVTATCGCAAGYGKVGNACLPACGATEMACALSGATAAQAADSLTPPVNKWTCGSGGLTNSCEDPAPPPTCGANEKLALDDDDELHCVCEPGHHRHKSACVGNPMCSSPLVENACKSPATPTNFANSAVYGKCKRTEADPCDPGTYRDLSDTAPQNGACGTLKNDCNPGAAVNKKSVTGKYTWDCAGIAGSKNWQCVGAGGKKTWNCKNGGQTQECSLAAPGRSPSCSEPVAAGKATGCFACKSGYEACGNDCHAACGVNAVRNAGDCSCACKAGYEKDGGACKKFYTLTVIVDPEKAGRVTGNGFNCTGTCSKKLKEGTDVNLKKSSAAGWRCLFGASSEFKLVMDTTVYLNCGTTLKPNAGGPYTATYSSSLLPGGGSFSFYTARVSASATGGVSPYRFRWEGQTKDSATAIYVFVIKETYHKDVAVTDSAKPPRRPETARAKIHAGTSRSGGVGGAAGAGGEPVPFEVPLGGELRIVWGEDSAVTASSGDAKVARVSVASPEIRVTGVGVGATDVIVKTDGGELRLPVAVK